MATKIGEHYDANGIKETWWDNGDGDIIVQRSQDTQAALDLVAAVNADGGAKTLDGLGRPIAEIDLLVLQEYAKVRGIPWEKLAYSPEYDKEFLRLCEANSRLQYSAAKTIHALQ